jgi:hypothetical protein
MNIFKNLVLRITFITGIILFVLTGVFLTGFYFLERSAGRNGKRI